MCSPSAALGGASKILSGIGQSQQIKAQNRAKRRAWERQMEIRKRNWLQNITTYKAKVNKYNIDLNENDLASNRAYEQARANLNATRSKALAGSESSFMKMVKERVGKRAASGKTGRSAARYETMVAAEYGRSVGKRAFALTRSREAYIENVQATRRQALSARNKLYSNVAFQPVPTMAPQYPPMQNSSMPIFQGILGAAAGAASEMGSEENNLFSNNGSTDSWGMESSLTGDSFTDYGGSFDMNWSGSSSWMEG